MDGTDIDTMAVNTRTNAANIGGSAFSHQKESTVTDIDGNVYQTVTIGAQTWMAENLRTTRYADGTPITNGTLNDPYSYQGSCYYIYENDPLNASTYGLLYTWWGATNTQGIFYTYPDGIQGACPTGWHIPNQYEKDVLIDCLGGHGQWIGGGDLP